MDDLWFIVSEALRKASSAQVSRDELARFREELAALEAWADEVETSQLRSKLLEMNRWEFSSWSRRMLIPYDKKESREEAVNRILNIRRGILVKL